MKGIKFLIMLVCSGLIFLSWSGEVVKVLQNGLEGYEGCADAYVISKAGFELENFGEADTLELRWDDG